MYEEDDFLLLSGIQHFIFCRRQWALIHVEQQWNENSLTAEGNLEHNRVHDDNIVDIRNGKITMRGMKVYSRRLGVSGDCDAVEFTQASDGITLSGRVGKWMIVPVEYKHGTKKSNDCDRLQVVLQAMCLEEMFSCEIKEADLFYFEQRRREKISITQEMRSRVEDCLREMHSYMNRGYTPKAKVRKACSNCSLNSICLPELMKNNVSVESYIKEYIGA